MASFLTDHNKEVAERNYFTSPLEDEDEKYESLPVLRTYVKGGYEGAQVVVLCSGGLDSVTLAEHYRQQGKTLFCLSIDYGQRNIQELEYARVYCERRGITWAVVDISSMGLLMPLNALTDRTMQVQPGRGNKEGMMPVYVPNRNAIFLTIACGIAVSQGAAIVGIGLCDSGEFHYPDTTPRFLQIMREMQSVALQGVADVDIEAPFMPFSKMYIAQRYSASGLNGSDSWSCYDQEDIHCGVCPACRKRQWGFKEAEVSDTTEYNFKPYEEDLI